MPQNDNDEMWMETMLWIFDPCKETQVMLVIMLKKEARYIVQIWVDECCACEVIVWESSLRKNAYCMFYIFGELCIEVLKNMKYS